MLGLTLVSAGCLSARWSANVMRCAGGCLQFEEMDLMFQLHLFTSQHLRDGRRVGCAGDVFYPSSAGSTHPRRHWKASTRLPLSHVGTPGACPHSTASYPARPHDMVLAKIPKSL